MLTFYTLYYRRVNFTIIKNFIKNQKKARGFRENCQLTAETSGYFSITSSLQRAQWATQQFISAHSMHQYKKDSIFPACLLRAV